MPRTSGHLWLHPWEGWPSGGAGLGPWPLDLLANARLRWAPSALTWPSQVGTGSRADPGQAGGASPLVWPLNWGPAVTYTWNTGCSWITSSSPKLVVICRWVDVCLKIVMLPGGTGAQQAACFGTSATEALGARQGLWAYQSCMAAT